MKDNQKHRRDDDEKPCPSRKPAGLGRTGDGDDAETSDAKPRGDRATPYEEWTAAELYNRAREVNIDGRSWMDKAELIEALRKR